MNFDGLTVCITGARWRERKGKEKLMNGSLHVGLAALGAALGVGLIGMKASEAVGRNPDASTKILVQSILAIAFAEAIVFYALFLVK
jgi:F-type H+-transporting ATPase subunit c